MSLGGFLGHTEALTKSAKVAFAAQTQGRGGMVAGGREKVWGTLGAEGTLGNTDMSGNLRMFGHEHLETSECRRKTDILGNLGMLGSIENDCGESRNVGETR